MPKVSSSLFRPATTHIIMGTPGDNKYTKALRLIRKVSYAGSNYQIFVPRMDPRSNKMKDTFDLRLEKYSGFQSLNIKSEMVKSAKEILEKIKLDTTTVGIFGAQFFDLALRDVIQILKREGKYIIIAGTDKTFEGNPFGPMGYLAIDADIITKTYGACSHLGCKNIATRTVKKVDKKVVPWGTTIVDIDAEYENVCLLHHNCPGAPENKFIEKYKKQSEKLGKLNVFFGTMCSGKSEMMLAEVLHESRKQGIEYIFLKPKIDTRSPNEIVSRTFKEIGDYGLRFPAEEIDENNMWEFVEKAKEWKKRIIGIDEAQFIPNIIYFVNALRLLGHDVIASGLSKDFKRELFGDMDYLICEAETVEPLEAVCTINQCNNKATEVQRLINNEPSAFDSPIIIIEGSDTKVTYHPRCMYHHEVPGKPEYPERKIRRKS